jgi:DNA modification methylase
MEYQIIHDDCLHAMQQMADNSVDFIVTDPPYGLHFMGKSWDKFNKSNFDENGMHKHLDNASIDGRSCNVRKVYCANAVAGTYDENLNDEFQEFIRIVGIEMLRILKPGGMLAMFGAPRRHHRQMSGLEDAGFEIRDCIAWIFGQGFPKSHRISKHLDAYLQEADICQCVENKPCNEYTIPLQNAFDHICNLDIWKQAVNVTENDLYDLKKVLGFQDDYQFDHHSYDEFLRLSSILYLKLFPSQECVQEHNHYDAPYDVQVYESLYNLLQVRYNDLLSKQDLILSSFYQLVFSLLEGYKVDHGSADDWHKKLNKQQDFLTSFHKLVERKNPLNILDIFCLVFCLPFPLIKLLSLRKLETIIPWFDICLQCNRLKDHWKGYGTALKPAYEPIIICMKPLDGTFAKNAEKWGVGGINIESSRVGVSQHEKDLLPLTFDNESFSSPEFCCNALFGISSALKTCNNFCKDHWRNGLKLDGTSISVFEYESLVVLLYPNGVWCGLNLSLIQDSQSDCPVYRHLYDELLPNALKNALLSAPLLGDALHDIFQFLLLPANIHFFCNDLPSTLDVLDLLRALLNPLFNPTLYLSQTKMSSGRWPSNLILSEESAVELDKTTGNLKGNCGIKGKFRGQRHSGQFAGGGISGEREYNFEGYHDNGGASRFFKIVDQNNSRFLYCAKASSSERNRGLDKPCSHPTVKPLSLIKYIIKLLAPPNKPIMLDPFLGSGTSLVAAKELGISAIGIEKEKEYVEIATKRLDAAKCINQMEMFNG